MIVDWSHERLAGLKAWLDHHGAREVWREHVHATHFMLFGYSVDALLVIVQVFCDPSGLHSWEVYVPATQEHEIAAAIGALDEALARAREAS